MAIGERIKIYNSNASQSNLLSFPSLHLVINRSYLLQDMYYSIGRGYTMAIGERIKRIRNFRKLTQAQLGEAVGLSDVRIRQYEIGNRTPKKDMI